MGFKRCYILVGKLIKNRKMKVCTKCKEEKSVDDFHSDKQKKDNKASRCKICKNKDNYKRSSTNKAKLRKKEYDAIHRKTESGIIKELKSQEKRKKKYATNEAYRQKELSRGLVNRNKEGAKDKQAEYQRNLPLVVRAKHNREYRQRNRSKFNKWSREYCKKNKHIGAWRQILADTHRRFGTTKEGKTIIELGYSANELKAHLQSLFTDGMNWDNHGEWHIDHIKPVSAFDKYTDVSIVNSLSNLQPLWAFDNLSKSNYFCND